MQWQSTCRLCGGALLLVAGILPVWGTTPEVVTTKLPPIVFVVQERLGNPDGVVRYHSRPVVKKWGCQIQWLNPAEIPLRPKVIYQNPHGAILDMNVSWDAQTIFFSMRQGEADNWHLYEIGVDGRGFRQITTGPFHDFSPAELPDGDLVFASSRLKSFNICAWELSTGLFRVRRDGTGYRQLTVNTLNDFSPQLLPNGQVLYTRWEYVDRDVKWRQSLWTINPDGSHVQLYFGNTIRDPAVFWQARPIPGNERLVATFAPHHGWPMGAIGTITRSRGVEAPRGVGFDWITQEYPQILDLGQAVEWAYRDPFPLSAEQFLVSYGGGRKTTEKRFGIYLLQATDQLVKVWSDPLLSCTYPLPLTPRPRPPVLPCEPWPREVKTGTFVIQNVYRGLGDAVRPGEIKAIRLLEQVAKFPQNETGEGRYRMYSMNPVMGRHGYYVKRCLGVVPVEADGSAHFTAPVFRELYFQALDAEGRAVQSMGSAVNLIPGETQSCVGCHDSRDSAPPAGTPMATRRPPSVPTPYDWGNEGRIDFNRLVQPVLDRHCVGCHGGAQPKGNCDLSGDKTRFFNMAYDHLYRRNLMHTIELTNNDAQVMPPKKAFAWVSRLRDYLEGRARGHEKIAIPQPERERVYLWMDTNANYYGTYERTRPGTPGDRDLWAADWFKLKLTPQFNANCVACHRRGIEPDWINLSHPENSLLVRAHLAGEAGGRGLNRALKDGRQPPRFSSLADPVCAGLLTAIMAGQKALLAHPRIDMPGAVPQQGPQDWGLFRGTADPHLPAPGKFWPD